VTSTRGVFSVIVIVPSVRLKYWLVNGVQAAGLVSPIQPCGVSRVVR
jgi:hypothetical protein